MLVLHKTEHSKTFVLPTISYYVPSPYSLMQLVSLVPTDPRVLQRLGELYDGDNDRSQAFQYYYESFRYCPTNIDVISWLGAYYMDSHFADKAIVFFERAALIQPNQINWQLMVASCYRKTGDSYASMCMSYRKIRFFIVQ